MRRKEFAALYLPFQPSVYQPAGYAQFLGNLGQARFVVEGSRTQLFILKLDGAALVLSGIAYHNAAGIGPRLAPEVFQVLDGKPRFLHHFAPHTFFERFARLEKSRYQPLEGATEMRACTKSTSSSPRLMSTMMAGDMRG